MRRPDIAGACVASRFSPGDLRAPSVVNGHLEVVAIGQAKAGGCEIAIAGNVTRYLCLTAPRISTIATGAVEQIPRATAHVGPGNTHISASCSRSNGGEGMFDALRGE